MNLFEFGDPPESVIKNVEEMSDVMRQRRNGNAAVATKNDTERYLVVVFKNREERETVLRGLGLPHDERYVWGGALDLKIREGMLPRSAVVAATRDVKAADVGGSGAGG